MRSLALATLLFVAPTARAGELVLGVGLGPSLDEPGIAYGAQLAYRAGRFGAHLRVEHSAWLYFDTRPGFFAGTVDVALGGEVLFFDRKLVSSLSAGTATLLQRTSLDDPGATGLFLDVRPLGLRWPVGSGRLALRLDPLHLTLVAPVLAGIPLLQVQYRTTFALEWTL